MASSFSLKFLVRVFLPAAGSHCQPPPVCRAAIEIGGHKPQPENTMINYILLVSRQGAETRPPSLSHYP